MSDELGKRLVRALIEDQDTTKLAKAGISPDDIWQDAKKANEWATKFFVDNRKWPTPKQVGENTGIALPEPPEDLEYVCDLVRKRRLGKSIERDVKGVIGQLESRDPDEALRLIALSATKNRSTGKQGAEVRSFRQLGPDRYKDYQELQSVGGLMGLATPWPRLNESVLGWVDGQLHVIVALQNTGKTWATIICADHVLNQGKKVLLISMEMSAKRIERRLDAMHYRIPFGDLRDVEVDLVREMRWKDGLRAGVGGKGDILVADKQLVRYVSDVTSLTLEYEPDMVVVDGGYRFASKGGNGDWESSKAIVADLQETAEATDIPWIVTTQQGEVGENSRMGAQKRAFKVKYAKEWVINPDVVIEMYADEDMRLTHQMEWKLLKERESKGETQSSDFRTVWDLSRMCFDQIASADDFKGAATSVTY